MRDEFEERLSEDWLFDGSAKDIEELWMSSKTRWYPWSFVERGPQGTMFCRITDVICEDNRCVPIFCDGNVRRIETASGEHIHVSRAVLMCDVKPLPCCTQTHRLISMSTTSELITASHD